MGGDGYPMVEKIAFLFPGQGSQYVGMGRADHDRSAAARSLFSQADELLGFPLSRMMFEGPEESLRATENTQPALFVASAAALANLREADVAASLAAGHSLGEYSALYAAGVLSFDAALRLVRKRGQAMQVAAAQSKGAMAAVMGLDPAKLEAVCADASATGGVCVPANYNSESQIVISGDAATVAKACELAKGAGALKVVPLNVSGAFHSPLMAPAVDAMTEPLRTAPFNDGTIPVVANVDATATVKADDFRCKLREQIDHSVRWLDTMRWLLSSGVETFVEVGAGKVLGTITRKLDRTKRVFWTDDFDAAVSGLTAASRPS